MYNEIRAVRTKSGESLQSLALRAGMEPSHLSLVERGKSCNRRTADKIATALGVSPKLLWAQYEHLRQF